MSGGTRKHRHSATLFRRHHPSGRIGEFIGRIYRPSLAEAILFCVLFFAPLFLPDPRILELDELCAISEHPFLSLVFFSRFLRISRGSDRYGDFFVLVSSDEPSLSFEPVARKHDARRMFQLAVLPRVPSGRLHRGVRNTAAARCKFVATRGTSAYNMIDSKSAWRSQLKRERGEGKERKKKA